MQPTKKMFYMKKTMMSLISAAALSMIGVTTMMAADIKGTVVDKQTREPLVGATVTTQGTGAVCDVDGRFVIRGLKAQDYTLTVK